MHLHMSGCIDELMDVCIISILKSVSICAYIHLLYILYYISTICYRYVMLYHMLYICITYITYCIIYYIILFSQQGILSLM